MKTLLQLFWAFFKIGAFTFGSGYAMIQMIEKEVVDKRKWFEKDEFYDQFALASSAPGPFALNTAVFVGYKLKGWWGSLAAVCGAVLPSFLIILAIAMYLTDFRDNRYVEAAFKGIRPAVELVEPLVGDQVIALPVQGEGRAADAVAHPAHRGAQVGAAAQVALVAVIAQDRLLPPIAQACHRGPPAADPHLQHSV